MFNSFAVSRYDIYLNRENFTKYGQSNSQKKTKIIKIGAPCVVF